MPSAEPTPPLAESPVDAFVRLDYPSYMGTLIPPFVLAALAGALISQTKVAGRATPLVFFLGIGTFAAASACLLMLPPLWFIAIAAGVGWISGFAGVFIASSRRA